MLRLKCTTTTLQQSTISNTSWDKSGTGMCIDIMHSLIYFHLPYSAIAMALQCTYIYLYYGCTEINIHSVGTPLSPFHPQLQWWLLSLPLLSLPLLSLPLALPFLHLCTFLSSSLPPPLSNTLDPLASAPPRAIHNMYIIMIMYKIPRSFAQCHS